MIFCRNVRTESDADDKTLCGKIAGQIDIENIEMELKNVTEWLKMNKLYLNVKNQSHVVSYATKENYCTNNTNKWNNY